MPPPPFLTFAVRRKRDVVRVRHCARQVAALLHFPNTEQACIAAGAFTVACQALAALREFLLCFQIRDGQLHVYARRSYTEPAPPNPSAEVPSGPAEGILRLAKPLPEDRVLSEVDVAWLVQLSEEENGGIFEEIVKQNQEVLALLHELHVAQKQAEAGKPAQPYAA
jgi:hypothetical protein